MEKIDISRKRWVVHCGNERYMPQRLHGALDIAESKLWGSMEKVIIEPVILPPKYKKLANDKSNNLELMNAEDC